MKWLLDQFRGRQPERLAEMIELWWGEAERNGVLPLDDRLFDLFKKKKINVLTGVKADIKKTKNGVTVTAGKKTIEADQCLVCATEDLKGRRSNL